MRLTNTHRQAFILAVMNDVPDLKDLPEYKEVIRVIDDQLKRRLPEVIYSVYKDKELKKYLNSFHGFSDFPARLAKVANSMHREESYKIYSEFGRFPISVDVDSDRKVTKALENYLEKMIERSKIRTSITQLIHGVSTLNRAKEILPKELHKYLPAEASNTGSNSDRSLPVVTNVIYQLRDAGWPVAPTPRVT
jgi:hypothetical protein